MSWCRLLLRCLLSRPTCWVTTGDSEESPYFSEHKWVTTTVELFQLPESLSLGREYLTLKIFNAQNPRKEAMMRARTMTCLRSSLKVTIVTLVVGAACLGTGQLGAEGTAYSCHDPPYNCHRCMNILLFGSRCVTTLPGVVGYCNCSQEQVFPAGTMCTLGESFCEVIIIEGSTNKAGCAAAFPQPQPADSASTRVPPARTLED